MRDTRRQEGPMRAAIESGGSQRVDAVDRLVAPRPKGADCFDSHREQDGSTALVRVFALEHRPSASSERFGARARRR